MMRREYMPGATAEGQLVPDMYPVDLCPLRGGGCLWFTGFGEGRAESMDAARKMAAENIVAGEEVWSQYARQAIDEWAAGGYKMPSPDDGEQ